MKIRLRGRERQEAEDHIVVAIRLASSLLSEYEGNPFNVNDDSILLAGILLYLVSRDGL